MALYDNKNNQKTSFNKMFILILSILYYNMKINKYVSIPKRKLPYISYLEFYMSLSSGILAIIIQRLYRSAHDHMLALVSPFAILTCTKLIIVINYYILRRNRIRSVLQNLAQVKLEQLLIPSIIKTMTFGCFILAALSINSLLLCLLIVINLFLIQYVSLRMKHSRKLNYLNIIYYGLVVISYFLCVDSYSLSFNIQTNIFIILVGSIIPISFFYLHREIFHIYKSTIDEVLSKQCIIQIFNITLIVFLIAITKDQQLSFNLHLLVQQPLLVLAFVFFGIIYEYFLFQMLDKMDFKYIFMTQVSAIIWLNIYIMSQTSLQFITFLSTLLAIIALIILIRVINAKTIRKMQKWFLDKMRKRQQPQYQEQDQVHYN